MPTEVALTIGDATRETDDLVVAFEQGVEQRFVGGLRRQIDLRCGDDLGEIVRREHLVQVEMDEGVGGEFGLGDPFEQVREARGRHRIAPVVHRR